MKLIAIFLFLILSVILNILTKEEVFRISIEHQRLLRTKYHSSTLDKVCLFISEIGDKYFITLAISIACNTLSTHKLFTFVLVSSSSIAITNLMKSVF